MNNELYHYGVLGMKWGVRRYQPYGSGGYDPKKKGSYIGKKGLTDKQKKALKIGAIAVGASLAVVGGLYLYKSGKMGSLVNLGKRYLQKNKKEFDSFKPDTFDFNSFKPDTFEFDSFKPDTFDFKTEYKNFQANKHIPGASSVQRTVVNKTPVERAVVKRTPIERTSIKQSPMDLSKYKWVKVQQIDSAGKASTIRVPAAEDMDRYARDWAKYMSSNNSDWSYDYAYNYINKLMKHF